MYIINECEIHKIEFNYLLKLEHFKGSSKEFYLHWEQFQTYLFTNFQFIYKRFDFYSHIKLIPK